MSHHWTIFFHDTVELKHRNDENQVIEVKSMLGEIRIHQPRLIPSSRLGWSSKIQKGSECWGCGCRKLQVVDFLNNSKSPIHVYLYYTYLKKRPSYHVKIQPQIWMVHNFLRSSSSSCHSTHRQRHQWWKKTPSGPNGGEVWVCASVSGRLRGEGRQKSAVKLSMPSPSAVMVLGKTGKHHGMSFSQSAQIFWGPGKILKIWNPDMEHGIWLWLDKLTRQPTWDKHWTRDITWLRLATLPATQSTRPWK